MLVVLHVIIALSSILVSTLAYFNPSQAKIRGSYGLIAATIASGTLLVFTTSASILRTCIMGLIYVSIATAITALASRRLASEKAE